MPWNLINEALDGLHIIQMYDNRDMFRDTAKKAIIAIEALIKENERLKNNVLIHSKWIPVPNDEHGEYQCENCGWVASRDAYGYFREESLYCKCCGAKMDKDEVEE